jgi:hypothetical protein
MRARAVSGRNGARADDEIAVHEARGLARRDAAKRLIEVELEALVLAGASRSGDACKDRARPVTEPDPVDALAVAMQDGPAQDDPVSRKIVARAHRDGVPIRIGSQHIQRLGR